MSNRLRVLCALPLCLALAVACQGQDGGKPAAPSQSAAPAQPAAPAPSEPALSAPVQTAPAAPAPAKSLQSDKDKRSYALGLEMGGNIRQQKIDMDLGLMIQGLQDAYGGGQTLLSEDEKRETLAAFQRELMEKRGEEMRQMAENNQKAGETFLNENKTKEGVVTTASGLQYKVQQEGSGAKPGPEDVVTVHYAGRLLDGTEFDSSYKRGQPATFPVGGVIPGWTEALQLMSPGAKYQVWIPSSLAYGPRGVGPIPPNALLVFDIELISIQPKDQPEQGAGQPAQAPSSADQPK